MRLGETGCVEDDVIVVRYPVPPLHLRADSVAYHTSDAVRTDQIARLKGLLVIVLADDPNCNALLILLRACERSEEHTSELQSLMRISYAVFCLKKKKNDTDICT